MQVFRTEDQRSFLQRATRKELERFAKARGVSEVEQGMPAPLMRQILIANNQTDIEAFFPYLRGRAVGQMNGVNATGVYRKDAAPVDTGNTGMEVSAEADLARQWKQQQQQKPQAPMKMHELRAACKAAGITVKRTDKADDLRAKLNG